MNMPGFTGEASLYKTSAHYYMGEAETISSPQVVPQVPLTLLIVPPWLSFLFFGGLTCHDMYESCWPDCMPLPNNIGQNQKYKCLDCCDKKFQFCIEQVGLGPGGWFHFPYSPKCHLPPYTFF
jgi:hypothetical protein